MFEHDVAELMYIELAEDTGLTLAVKSASYRLCLSSEYNQRNQVGIPLFRVIVNKP